MRILYIDCAAGVSGDMLLAGFVDLGLPWQKVKMIPRSLGLSSVRLERKILHCGGVLACRIVIRGQRDMSLPRKPADLTRWVRQSRVSTHVKSMFGRVIRRLAKAESHAHKVPISRVHFHQLSGIDTLVSMIGFCVGLSYFRVGAVHASSIPVGSLHRDPAGKILTRPGPATLFLLKGLPVRILPDRFEWTTPTGAALLASFLSPGGCPPFRLLRIGRGAGQYASAARPGLQLLLGKRV